LITSGVYALTGRVVTTDTVAALLTILGYSLYDTIIVFDRVRENIPRMPRAAFSQIVNRSMSEVLTRSLATTSCTLLPVIALLLFGGSTLKDFAFALLIGVASGAYSSIFIASPVLRHWKEREPTFKHRIDRITAEYGYVPAYAETGSDVDPVQSRIRRGGRLTTPDDPQGVSSAEFEQMKRDLGLGEEEASHRTSTIVKRLSHATEEPEAPAKPSGRAAKPRPARRSKPAAAPAAPPVSEPEPEVTEPDLTEPEGPEAEGDFTRAPDIAENEGIARPKKPAGGGASKSRSRRHGRKR
jgi:SecD/SecF fusion protein